MGVPAFFRWLSRKYPSIIVNCVEEKKEEVGGILFPVDASKPNPNGVEFDNLYLDMNGIIHPCTHPEDRPPPKDEDEMMIIIFEYIDRLFSIVRPRKLLYMAIDGVAPRAKMNQQRTRRFRASKETIEKVEEVSRLRAALLDKGAFLPPEKPKESYFDSNCITPGTPFMERLSACLHYYIHERLNNDPGWKGIKVILSDTNVPGEGEHKIMDFIRKQRAHPDHDPNTQHCLYGADADLIMLGLATHEPNFTIIREEFRPNKPKPCDICNLIGHEMKDCMGFPKPIDGTVETQTVKEEVPFIFLRLNVLREYLERDLQMPNLPFKYDFERVIDDWVFMCFFVGNDFLPHLPSLEIREGAIDRLVNLYRSCVYKTGGFVTDSGKVDLHCVQIILNELGKVEDEIFKKRQQTDQMFKEREKNRKKLAMQNKDGTPAWVLGGQYAPVAIGSGPATIRNPRQNAYQGRIQRLSSNVALESLIRLQQGKDPSLVDKDNAASGVKRRYNNDSSDEEVNDEVRLWEDGFKDRYYESKFDVGRDNLQFRVRVAHEYVKGLCWILRYYYQGCASWKWFFPYHYAPFASDFINIENIDMTFEQGTQPFRPLEQLLGVFPAASSSHVPKPFARLMHDPDSPIIDFYPVDFKIDLNGKKFAWQGVALLPFVDEKRLFKALEPYYDLLTPAERKRNIRGDDRVYVGREDKCHSFLKGIYENPGPQDQEIDFCCGGIRGKVLLTNECVGLHGFLRSPIKNLPPIKENIVLCARFRDPSYSADFIFPAKRLKGAIEPQRVLKPDNRCPEQNRNWRPQLGMTRRNQVASLEPSGLRTLEFYNSSIQKHNQSLIESFSRMNRGMYSQVGPPPALNITPRFNITQPIQNYGYHTAQGSRSGNSDWHNNQRQRDGGIAMNYQSYGERDNRGYHNRQNRKYNYEGNDWVHKEHGTRNQSSYDNRERRFNRNDRGNEQFSRGRDNRYNSHNRGYTTNYNRRY